MERNGHPPADADRRLVVAMGGASGAIYGVRFLRQAVRHFDEVYLMLSANARAVLATELDIHLPPGKPAMRDLLGIEAPQVRFCDSADYFTPPASGSFRHAGMVIIPCSMGTVGRIASGASSD